MSTVAPARKVAEGDVLWTPPDQLVAASNMARFMNWLKRARGLSFADYGALWEWSVADLVGFWSAIWSYFDIQSDTPYERVVSPGPMPGVRWFEGGRVNFAEHVLRHEAIAPEDPVFLHASEIRPLSVMTWRELGDQVRALATALRAMGVGPGDRVVSYMPNIPETAAAMLATTAIGAIWSSASPEFGASTVIDRFGQIEPKVLFAADGYRHGGKSFDRLPEIRVIAAALPTLESIVWLPYLSQAAKPVGLGQRTTNWADVLCDAPVDRDAFRYARVQHDHPLWILFSSGTTGTPKAIVHSHAGILVEHLKVLSLHLNLGPSTRLFLYTTAGWMMWNTLMGSLLTGSSAVLYDGSPMQDGADFLFRLAAQTRATLIGVSPTLVRIMQQEGACPKATYDLSCLREILLGGAPSTPETFAWLYDNVRPDMWVSSNSGGTEFCSGLVGGAPQLPVRAGESQARLLGMDVHVWNEAGEDVVNEVGELVVTSPAPSMPLFLWNDPDGARYRETYFDMFANVWRHGDLMKINERGGCVIYGRSDSTLNRFGVRIGTAEIYRAVEKVEAVEDSLVICCVQPGAEDRMILFAKLRDDAVLSEEIISKIKARLREESPRHVPDEIHAAPQIPYTLTGKKMEVPVRKIVTGEPLAKAASLDAMANPEAMTWYVEFARRLTM